MIGNIYSHLYKTFNKTNKQLFIPVRNGLLFKLTVEAKSVGLIKLLINTSLMIIMIKQNVCTYHGHVLTRKVSQFQ